MTEKQEQILELLQKTIYQFNKREQYLLKNDLCERCICGKFAMYIERAIPRSSFKEYTTDIEYDRGMGGTDYGKKRLFGNDAYLDLIVHKRGYNYETGYDNLFAVEMKKSGRDFTSDKERLKMLVDNANGFNYRASFAIRIITDVSNNLFKLEIEESFFNEQDF